MNRRGARRTPLPICASLLWLAGQGVLYAQPLDRLPNLDKRHDNLPAARPLPAQKASAFAQLKALLPDARVDWDPLLETPKFIRASHGFLVEARDPTTLPRAVMGARPDRHEPVRRFLARHASVFGHGPEALDTAKIRREFVTPHNGLRTTVWEQQVDGVPVYQGVLVAHITDRGELAALSSQFLPDPAQAADRGTIQRHALRAAPPVSPAEAVVLAAQNIGETVPVQQVRAVLEFAEAAGGHHQFTAPALRGPAGATLVWLPLDPSRLRLCWQIILTSQSRGEMFLILVDARSGEIWVRQGLTEYLSDATYRVFTSDSPTPFSPGFTSPATTQPPVVPRAAVTLGAISTNASPAGWIPDGDNETLGNNVDAHLDWNGDDAPDLPRPQGSPFRVFDFPLDLGQDPRQSGDAAVVQLFYWCNWMHDRLYELGFTEAAGNFQRLNFGRGGLENDPVLADAQDGSGLNNATFSSPPDGFPGRMEMFLWDNTIPRRDAAFDAEVVLHEYTHGLSSRRVGGGGGLGPLQSRGLGEGWSDFYALALLSEPGDDPNATYAAGAYSSYQLRGVQENYYYGIRRYPYSTDLSKNPLTFKDIDPTVASLHDDVPRNPAARGSPDEVHRQGEVWCVVLWEARANLIAKWGYETGNDLSLRLVTDALNLTPPNPDFLEARDAILLADLVNHQGANFFELWRAFAKRGLGAGSSAPPSSTTTGVQEAFDLPDNLVVIAPSTQEFRGPAGGPFLPERQRYEVRNLGTNQSSWLATQSGKWLSLALSRTDLAPGAPPGLIEVFLNPLAKELGPGIYRESIALTNLTSGRTQSFPVTLRVYPLDHFTEEFSDSPIDLDFQTLTFTPDGSPNFYSVCRTAAAGFPSDSIDGSVLGLSDDSFVQITLADGKEVSLFGRSTSTLYVGSNGYLSFDGGDVVSEATLSRHFDRPRISGLFRDLDPQAGGMVSWRQWPDRVAITFQDVPEYSQTNRNSFQIEIFFDGVIRVTWLEIDATHGIAGLSRGEGMSESFVESDLSESPRCSAAPALRVPAVAREGDGLLSGRGNLVLSEATDVDLVFSLASSNPREVLLPGSVTVRAGTSNALFDLRIVDDDLLDLTQPVYLSAHGVNGESAFALIEVRDNETGTLSVSIPASGVEGASFEGTVTASVAAVSDIVVNLVSSNPDQIRVPPEVLIPAGRNTATFVATLPDNGLIDGTRAAGVIARVPGWTDGSASIEVLDNESRTLTLRVPVQASEGDGTLANSGAVELGGSMTEDLLVVLFSVDDSEIKVPTSVMIPAGRTNATFDITVVDDAIVDGTQSATLYAFAVDFRQGRGDIAVHDNELVRLTLSLPPEVNEGDPVTPGTIEVSAAPANDVLISLSSSDTNQLQVPLTVRMPAGRTTVNFPLTVLDDAWLDGPQPVIVTAQVKNWTPGSATVIALDNEPPAIEVTLPAATSEASGVLSGAGQIRLGGLTVTNRVVTLLSSDTNELVVPEFVIIPAGQSNAAFDLAIVDDARSDGRVSVIVTARAEGLADGEGTIIVLDNEVHGFVFTEIPSPQAAGVPFLVSVTAVDIATNRITDFTNAVSLRAAGPAGPHPLQPVDTAAFTNGVWTGAITLSVASPNVRIVAEDGLEHSGSSRSVEVVPGPLDHFEWSSITSPQRAGVPFPVTLVARDGFGNPVTGFNDGVTLEALIRGVPAALTFSPAGISNFVSGAWSGELVLQEPAAGLQIRAVDRLGHAGLANRLDVIRADDLELLAAGPAGPVAISNVFSYLLTVTNSGPGAATAVVVSNAVPSGAAFVSAVPSQGACTNQEGILICELGTLADSAHATIDVTLQAISPGTTTNTAFVRRGEPDADEANNVAQLLTRVTNLAPVIELVRPSDGERFFGPTNLLLEAQAADSEGIARVEFFEGTNKLGELTVAPYRFQWADVLPGQYTLTAIASDSFAATAVSAPVTISVLIPDQRTVPPAIAGLDPIPNSTNVPPDVTLEIRILNGDFPVDTNTITLQLNGTAVTPELTPTSEGLVVRYHPKPVLEPNAAYSVQFGIRDTATPGNEMRTNWTFTVANLAVLPAGLAAPSGSGGDRGFRGRIHKARNDAPPELFIGSNSSSNTAARADRQLNGQLMDPLTGLPFNNEAAGPEGDGTFVLNGFVNFDQSGRDAGLFGGDIAFPWVTGDDPDFMAMELRAYLELTSGVYRFGISHDEGFQLSVGAQPGASELILGRFEGTYNQANPTEPAEFEFVVVTNGLYGFRLLWWEGQGPAHLEWYARDRQTGERRLINASDVDRIPAYQFRVVPAGISLVEPGDGRVFGAPADIAITAVAAENDEPAASVDFFAGERLIGSAATRPFGILWTNVPSGSYLLSAVMTNRAGNPVTSAPVRIVVNASPILSTISDQTARENMPIAAIAFTVSDLESPASNLVVSAFSSNTDLLPDANIRLEGTTTNRSLTLLPQTNQSGVAIVRLVVSDGITNASVSFTLTITPANSPPILDPIADRTIDEGQQLSLTALASDPDLPAQTLTFSFGAEAPMGATLNATNGVVTWTPDEAQGPGTYAFVVRVTDDGAPPRSATQQFAVTVNEVNQPPVLVPMGHQTVNVGATLVVTNLATDLDLPANRLVFELGPGAPAGSTIDPVAGLLTWTVPADREPGTNTLTVRVTDNGEPPLSAEVSFTVGVVAPLQIERVALTDQLVTLTWRASPGRTYQVEYKTDLRKVAWNTLPITIAATNHQATFVDTLGSGPLKFYRIVEAP